VASCSNRSFPAVRVALRSARRWQRVSALALALALAACTSDDELASGLPALAADSELASPRPPRPQPPGTAMPWCETASASFQAGSTIDPRLNEVSGLAVSDRNPGILWVHNDSGDQPSLYAINDDGVLVAELQLHGATAEDWEDLAVGSCSRAPDRTCLFVGDFGQVTKAWNYAIYEVEEPELHPSDPSDPPRVIGCSDFITHRFSYPGGYSYNAEALARDPQGNLYILRKDYEHPDGNQLFRLAANAGETAELELVCDFGGIPMAQLITAADMNRRGTHLAIRTYQYVYELRLDRPLDQTVCDRPLHRLDYLGEGAGEAIAYHPGNNQLIAISERRRARIDRLDCARLAP
jgi:hypothetical protein